MGRPSTSRLTHADVPPRRSDDEGVARACLFRSARCACPVTSTVTAASAMKTFLGTELKNKVTSSLDS